MNFIINLDSRKDRWKKIEQQFKNNNLSFERFSAIEPNNLTKMINRVGQTEVL